MPLPLGVEFGAVYEITGPDGTRAVLNNSSDPDFVGFLTGDSAVTGLERAPVREVGEDLAEADGGVHGAFLYSRMPFTLSGQVDPTPRVEAGDYTDVSVETARNLAPNPRFVSAMPTDRWTPVGTTIAQVAGGGVRGTVTSTAAGFAGFFYLPPGAPGPLDIPATPGLRYSVTVDVRSLSPGPSFVPAIAFRDAAGADLGSFNGSSVAGGSSGIATATAIAPAGTASVGVIFYIAGAIAVGNVLELASFAVVQGTPLDVPFSGATFPGGVPQRTMWLGTPDASPSTLSTVTRTMSSEAEVAARRQGKLKRATNAMRADAVLRWAPTSAPPVQVRFRQQQPLRITNRRPKSFLIAGVSELNVIESQAVRTAVADLAATASGGVVSPVTSPVNSGATSAGVIVAEANGDSEAWPIITIRGPVTNPVVRSLRYGLSLRFAYTLVDGEELVVDTAPRRRTILLNGTADRYSALDWNASTWFPLAPGTNDLRVGSAMFSTGSRVTVAWRDAWG